MTAKKYLLDIGFDDAHLPELFNNDDKSYYQIAELMESYHQAKLKLLGIGGVVSSTDLDEPTFAEMREEVLSNKLWKKKDGLYWHFKWGTKTLREAYKIATS